MPPANAAQLNPTTPAHELINTVTDPIRWAILKCLQVQKTAKEVADELQLKPSNCQYHLKKLVEAGLVDEFSHPDYARRFLYLRRTMEGKISIRERGIEAQVKVY